MAFAVAVRGLDAIEAVENLPAEVRIATVRAINKVARDQRAKAARMIQAQINVPASYLSGGRNARLSVAQQATRNRPEAIIRARGRPTSLARFATGSVGSRAPVRVEVKPGQASYLRRAFLIRLPQGSTQTDTRFNLGLAIRLRPGERLENKVRQVRLAKGLYLLYGPSVQQVFLNNAGEGVADDLTPETLQRVEEEFARLLKL